MTDISVIMESLNYSSMSTNYYHIKAGKAKSGYDQQVYTALENYYKGRKEAYLFAFDAFGIQLDTYTACVAFDAVGTVEYTCYVEALPL